MKPAPYSSANPGSLPHVPLMQFVRSMKAGSRRLFLLWAGLTAATSLLLLLSLWAPQLWHTGLVEVPETGVTELPAGTATASGLGLDYYLQAYFAYTGYTAPLYRTHPSLPWLLLLVTGIGWSIILAAAGHIGGHWITLIYIFFGFATFFSEAGKILSDGQDPYRLYTFGVLMCFLLPQYLFNSELLKAPLWVQFLAFLGLHLALYAVLWAAGGGLPAVFRATANQLPVTLVVLALAVLAASATVPSMLLHWSASSPNKARRKSPAVLGTLLGGWALYLLLVALGSLGYLELPQWLFSPLLPLAKAIVLLGFLLQNSYFQAKDNVDSYTGYAGIFMGAAVLGAGSLAIWQANHEFTLVLRAGQLIAVIFCAAALLFPIYLFFNFYSQLAKRAQVYYILYRPVRFRYLAVWFSIITIVIIFQGLNSFNILNAARCTWQNLRGDVEMADHNPASASAYYARATNEVYYDPKANLNWAVLNMPALLQKNDEELKAQISQRLENGFSKLPDKANMLALSNFFLARGEPFNALRILKDLAAKPGWDSPEVYANMGLLFFKFSQPDSAAASLNAGLEQYPSHPILLANLALIYNVQGKDSLCVDAIKAANRAGLTGSLAQANYYYLMLQRHRVPQVAVSYPDSADMVFPVELNRAVAAYAVGKYAFADSMASLLLPRSQHTSVYVLKMLTQAWRDSLDNALNRYQYLGALDEELLPMAAHNLGVHYHARQAPEMASLLLTEAAAGGLVQDAVPAAIADALAGHFDRAQDSLKAAAGHCESCQADALRELAILRTALGDDKALTAGGIGQLAEPELLRLAAYARAAGLPQNALPQLQRSGTGWQVQLALAALQTLDKQHSQAEGTLETIKKAAPDSAWTLAKAELLILRGRAADALPLLDEWLAKYGPHHQALYLKGQVQLAAGKPLEAENTLHEAIRLNRAWAPPYLLLLPLLEQRKQYDAADKLLERVLKINTMHPGLWLLAADAASRNNMPDAEAHCLQAAMEQTEDPATRQRIAARLAGIPKTESAGLE